VARVLDDIPLALRDRAVFCAAPVALGLLLASRPAGCPAKGNPC
jgi:hypothetical protein